MTAADIPAETDITNAVVNDLYLTCDTLHGDHFDATEQAIVFQTVVDQVMINNILGNPDNSDVIRNNFSGIILELPAGHGTLTITVKTEGDHLLAVLVGSDMQNFEQLVKGVIEVPYELAAAARAYLYGAVLPELPLAAPTKHMPRHAKADWIIEEEESSGSVAIYGISWNIESTEDIDELRPTGSAEQKILRDGQLFILRDGKIYNALGTQVK